MSDGSNVPGQELWAKFANGDDEALRAAVEKHPVCLTNRHPDTESTVLIDAVKGDRLQLVEWLVGTSVLPEPLREAVLNAGDAHRRTALHHACMRGQLDMVDCLLRGGAAVDPRDIKGCSPLFMARNEDVVQALMTFGADVSSTNNNGQLAHEYIEKLCGQTTPLSQYLQKVEQTHGAFPFSFGSVLQAVAFAALVALMLTYYLIVHEHEWEIIREHEDMARI